MNEKNAPRSSYRQNTSGHSSLNNNSPHRRINLLKISEVAEWVEQSVRNIHRMVSQGTFPKPITIGQRSKRWIESEINEWLEQQMRKRI